MTSVLAALSRLSLGTLRRLWRADADAILRRSIAPDDWQIVWLNLIALVMGGKTGRPIYLTCRLMYEDRVITTIIMDPEQGLPS